MKRQFIGGSIGEVKRAVEVRTEEGWAPVAFDNLREGDVFRLYESTGAPYRNGQAFKACAAAFDVGAIRAIEVAAP